MYVLLRIVKEIAERIFIPVMATAKFFSYKKIQAHILFYLWVVREVPYVCFIKSS